MERKKIEKIIINQTRCTPSSREVQNYLTTVASTVKLKKENGHVQRRVQWSFALNYSSRCGTVRIRVVRQSACGGLRVTWSSLDGLMDRRGSLTLSQLAYI